MSPKEIIRMKKNHFRGLENVKREMGSQIAKGLFVSKLDQGRTDGFNWISCLENQNPIEKMAKFEMLGKV